MRVEAPAQNFSLGFSMGGMDATRRFVADLQRAMTRAGWTVDLLATA